MTIDFSEGNGSIRFYGPVPTGTSFYGAGALQISLWTTTLVKVVNAAGISETVYTTTNAKERNEQIVYYR